MSNRLKTVLWCSLVLFIAAVAVGLYQARASFHNAIVDWRIMADDRFSLDPGQIRVNYQIPKAPNYGVWPQFEVESKYPVTLGFVPADLGDLRPNEVNDPMIPVRCKVQHIRKILLSCSELKVRQESYRLFVLDERAAGDTSGNSVHLQYTARMCINCKNP